MCGPLGSFSGRSFPWVNLVSIIQQMIHKLPLYTYNIIFVVFMSLQGLLPIRVFALTSPSAGDWKRAPGWDLQNTPPLRCEWDTELSTSQKYSSLQTWPWLWFKLRVFIGTRLCWTAGWIVLQTGRRLQNWLNIWEICYRLVPNRSVQDKQNPSLCIFFFFTLFFVHQEKDIFKMSSTHSNRELSPYCLKSFFSGSVSSVLSLLLLLLSLLRLR